MWRKRMPNDQELELIQNGEKVIELDTSNYHTKEIAVGSLIYEWVPVRKYSREERKLFLETGQYDEYEAGYLYDEVPDIRFINSDKVTHINMGSFF